MELISIHKFSRDGLQGVIDRNLVAKERADFGVAKTDMWCLHDYLARVMINGLVLLRKEGHGWPAGKEYPNAEDWDAALVDVISRLSQASTRDEQHDKIYDEILWGPEDSGPAGMEDLEKWLNRPPTPEFQEYSRRCREVDDLAEENIKFVMDWMSKWWFALWD